jgi:aminoglycoside 2'-N-acetyltransferase I
MDIAVTASADVPPDVRQAIGALSAAVYPPEVIATLPGIDLAWARPQRSLLVWDDGRLVAHVGVVVRDVLLDGQIVRIGGIGGVMTHPEAQGKGFARAAMRRAQDVFASDPAIVFALLVCPSSRVSFYERLDWRRFGGRLLVAQPAGAIAFTVNAVLVRPIHGIAPQTGTLDLCGLPW